METNFVLVKPNASFYYFLYVYYLVIITTSLLTINCKAQSSHAGRRAEKRDVILGGHGISKTPHDIPDYQQLSWEAIGLKLLRLGPLKSWTIGH
jgi:hypothetical protein